MIERLSRRAHEIYTAYQINKPEVNPELRFDLGKIRSDGKFVERSVYFDLPFSERKERHINYTSKVCGRVLSERGTFFDIRCGEETLQLFVDKSIRRDARVVLHAGSHVSVDGIFTQSNTGQLTLAVHDYSGLSEPDPIQKYPECDALVPFIVALNNAEARQRLINSHTVPQLILQWLNENSYSSVSTSSFNQVDSGLDSRPFAVDSDIKGLTLRRDFELETRAYLLFMEKIYQYGYVFRNEGESYKNRHEFLYVNAYSSYTDHIDTAVDCMQLFHLVTSRMRLAVPEILVIGVKKYLYNVAGVDNDRAFLDEAEKACNTKFNGDILTAMDVYYKRYAKRATSSPVLVLGYPVKNVIFAKKSKDDPLIAEDFRLLWQGRTIFHGSNDINKYSEQRDRYIERNGHDFLDTLSEGEKRYLEVLRYGLPPFSGYSISVDLLTQLSIGEQNVNNLRPTIV